MACIENGYQNIRAKRRWRCCVCWSRCTEMGHQMGEGESGLCASVFGLYIVDEIKKGSVHVSEIVH